MTITIRESRSIQGWRKELEVFEVRRLRLLRELQLRGTLAAVADALSYSPSTISQQLAQLEKDAGCWSRTGGG